ncbi:MAG: conjugal transfer protein TraR [Ignavibacteriaceae bacterium]|nr:conjugal transfer protein TraR [Ignavibacteriaceae bacterium]
MAKKATPAKKSADKKKSAKKPASSKKVVNKVKAVKKDVAKTKAKPKVAPAKKAKPVAKAVKVVKKSATKISAKPKTVKKVEKKVIEKKVTEKKVKKVAKQPEVVQVPEPAKKVAKIKGYSKKDLEHFKKIILEKRNEILDQLQNLRDQMMDPTTGEYINENSPYSLHMAEQGTDAMEREKTFLYAQRENKFLGYLEDALKRIEAGTYGICVECIDEPQHLCETCPLIPKARLEAVPHSQLCTPIKLRQEKKK